MGAHMRCLQMCTRPLRSRLSPSHQTFLGINMASAADQRPLREHSSDELSRIKLARETYVKELKYPLTFDEKKMEMTTEYPGLMYDDYDINTRQPKLWQIMKIFDACEVYMNEIPLKGTDSTFREYNKIGSNALQFAVSAEMSISRDLYDPSVPKCPLVVKTRGGYIGNTSWNVIDEMFSPNGTHLVTQTVAIVLVDSVTRRPLPNPDWWKSKYAKYAGSDKQLKVQKVTRPEETSVYQANVGFSDTDSNNHTNWTTYVRFSMDAAHFYSRKGQLTAFDMNKQNGVRKMQMLFSGESDEGDVLSVHVWESDDTQPRIVSHICKGEDLLCQVSFELFRHQATSRM